MIPPSRRIDVGPGDAGLYIHVPFCFTRCGYCDFNAHAGLDHLKGPFVGALLAEIDLMESSWRGVRFVSVFLGGGTPTTLARAAIAAILERIRERFDLAADAEVSCEANPDTVDEASLAALREAVEHARPIRYLESSKTDKEPLARRLLAESPVDEGLICAFKTLEPNMSFEYHRSPDLRQRGLQRRRRTCLHIYKYYRHPIFGFVATRLQTWFPFHMQIWLNGREWLAHQLTSRGHTDFRRHDKCFTWLGHPALAQRLVDRQLTTAWPRALIRARSATSRAGHLAPRR